MERFLVRDGIWWVGAVDWDVRDFHGYETQRGTTYNAYLIDDDKLALVDACRAGFGPELLSRVKDCCGGRRVEYLVVNHIEMDHSGALPWLVSKLSPVKILCSRRAKDGLFELYSSDGVDEWDIQVVGSGEEVSLGRFTLSFLEAPMLHWPDSMFTYVKEAKTLLPNDAFGQHLATSKRFADEVETGIVFDEASKYFANILMPFGNQILKTLDKVKELGLEIEAIGPSHGVIWRRPEDAARIVEAYARWSRFEADPKVVLIYETMWHSTEKMTRAIEDGIAAEGVECSVYRLTRSAIADVARAVLDSRGFLVGSATLNNGVLPAVGGFMTYLKGLRPKERIAGAYGSFGWGGGAVKQIDADLRALQLEVIDPLEIKYVPSREQLDACEEYGREVARHVKAWGV